MSPPKVDDREHSELQEAVKNEYMETMADCIRVLERKGYQARMNDEVFILEVFMNGEWKLVE